jgi:hypothetical protein
MQARGHGPHRSPVPELSCSAPSRTERRVSRPVERSAEPAFCVEQQEHRCADVARTAPPARRGSVRAFGARRLGLDRQICAPRWRRYVVDRRALYAAEASFTATKSPRRADDEGRPVFGYAVAFRLTRARTASGSRTGSQTRRPTGSHGPSHHCQTTLRGRLRVWPVRRWMTITIVRRRRVATIDASVEIVRQGLSRARTRTNTQSVRCAKVAAQPSRYANPSMRPDRIGPSYGGGNRTVS